MLIYFLQGATLGFSAAASPGAFQAYLLSQTIQHGLRRTLLSACAPLISDGPIIALVLFLLTQAPAWFLRGLQIVGGLFVLYLAWGAFRSFQAAVGTSPVPVTLARQSLLKAVLANALSPGPYIFWSVVAGPILLRAWGQSSAWGVSFLSGFYVAMIGGLAGLIILFATARRLGPQVTRVLNGVAAVALFILGVYQVWSGLLG